MYYKAFNSDLTGHGGYKFRVGETYETNTTDTWRWFHYTPRLWVTLEHYHKPNTTFCEVIPLGQTIRYGNYSTTNKIKIVRELSREEVYAILKKERHSKKRVRTYQKYGFLPKDF